MHANIISGEASYGPCFGLGRGARIANAVVQAILEEPSVGLEPTTLPYHGTTKGSSRAQEGHAGKKERLFDPSYQSPLPADSG
jgi:hypothetical protein